LVSRAAVQRRLNAIMDPAWVMLSPRDLERIQGGSRQVVLDHTRRGRAVFDGIINGFSATSLALTTESRTARRWSLGNMTRTGPVHTAVNQLSARSSCSERGVERLPPPPPPPPLIKASASPGNSAKTVTSYWAFHRAFCVALQATLFFFPCATLARRVGLAGWPPPRCFLAASSWVSSIRDGRERRGRRLSTRYSCSCGSSVATPTRIATH